MNRVKITKTARGTMILTRTEWEKIGKRHGWLHSSNIRESELLTSKEINIIEWALSPMRDFFVQIMGHMREMVLSITLMNYLG